MLLLQPFALLSLRPFHALLLGLVLIGIVAPLASAESGGFSGSGTGTLADPYQVSNWSELNEVRHHLDKKFILVNDLDASTAGWVDHAAPAANDGRGWVPIGFSEGFTPFTGLFNGNQHRIADLHIVIDSSIQIGGAGLFFSLAMAEGPGIHDLTLSRVTITADHPSSDPNSELRSVGVLAGGLSSGQVRNVTVEDSTITLGPKSVAVGGLIGVILADSLDGDILPIQLDAIDVDVSVTGGSVVGGVVGWIYTSSLLGHEPSGDQDAIALSNVVSRGDVVANGSGALPDVSGLCPESSSSSEGANGEPAAIFCDALALSGSAGGLVGLVGTEAGEAPPIRTVTLFGAEVHGSVSGGFSVGGLVGSAQLFGVDALSPGSSSIGRELLDRFLTDQEALEAYFETVNSPDFEASMVIADASAHGSVTGAGLVGGLVGYGDFMPMTRVHASGPVSSTAGDIGGFGGLVGFSVLASVIDAKATGEVLVVEEGVFGVGGLIGVSDVSWIERASASGPVNAGASSEAVGGLLGHAVDARVTASFASGHVQGGDAVGGLIGLLEGFTAAISTYATGNVLGDDAVGGMIGMIGDVLGEDFSITHSLALGAVNAGSGAAVGGFIGKADKALIGGDPADAIFALNSFWDVEVSGQGEVGAIELGAIGQSTLTLTRFANFDELWNAEALTIVQGWQPPNNPSWGICAEVNSGYPFLLWQFDEDPCSSAEGSLDNEAIAVPPVPVPVNAPWSLWLLIMGVLWLAWRLHRLADAAPRLCVMLDDC